MKLPPVKRAVSGEQVLPARKERRRGQESLEKSLALEEVGELKGTNRSTGVARRNTGSNHPAEIPY